MTTARASARDAGLGHVLQLQGLAFALADGHGDVAGPEADTDLRSGSVNTWTMAVCCPAEITEPTSPVPDTTGIPTPTPFEVPRSISIVRSKF